MDHNILYYPTMAIWESSWIKQTIFYWDRISTIIPRHLDDDIYRTDLIRELEDYGAFRPFHPDDYVHDMKHLSKEFKSLLKTEKRKKHQNQEDLPKNFLIDPRKMPKELIEYLVEKGIANQFEENLSFNKHDGYLYMALLAKYLSNQDDYGLTTPGTDQEYYQKMILEAQKSSRELPSLSFTLNQVLPIPREDVSIKQIMKFKEKHEVELLRTRQVIYSYQEQLRTVQENEQLQEVLLKCSEEIKKEVGQLDRACRSESMPTILGGVEAVLKVEAPSLLITEALNLSIPTEIIIGGASILGAVSIAKYCLDKRNEYQEKLAENALSYFYLANKQKLIDLQ